MLQAVSTTLCSMARSRGAQARPPNASTVSVPVSPIGARVARSLHQCEVSWPLRPDQAVGDNDSLKVARCPCSALNVKVVQNKRG